MSTDNRLLKLAQDDLANAQDNLSRALSAAQHVDPSRQWGQSGQTLNQIIDGYKEWERQALKAVEQAAKVHA